MRQAFSNKKALWDHLEQDNWFNGCDYPITHIQDHPKNLKLTYANMVKVFKNQLSVWMCDDSGYNTIELMEVNVYSKG